MKKRGNMSSKPKFDPSKSYDVVEFSAPKEKPKFDPSASFESMDVAPTHTQGEAARVKFEEGATAGARPLLAGIGDALGTGYGTFAGLEGMGLKERLQHALSEGGKAFSETKKATVKDQNIVSEEFPKTSLAANVAGNLLTLPLTPVKGVLGAAKLGAATGALSAASESENLSDAAQKVAYGATVGALSGRLSEGLGGLIKGVKGGLASSEINPLALKVGQLAKTIVDPAKKLASNVADVPGNFLAKVGSAATGVSEQEIKTFAKNPSKILKMFKDHGGDVQNMADSLREKWTANVKLARQSVNRDIEKGLSANLKTVSTDKILSALSKATEKLDSRYHAGQLAELTNVFDDIASKGGQVDLKTLNTTVQYLQDLATPSYSVGGKIFSRGDKVAQAAKEAAAVARRLLHDAAPEVGASYRKLAELHGIEKTLGRNLLKAGTSPNSVLSAGAAGAQGGKSLARLGKIVGQDMLGDARNASAARTFGNASFSPADFTGKAVGRMAAGAGLGYAVDGNEGMLIGSAMANPAMLKVLIRSGKVPIDILAKIPGFTGKITDDFIKSASRVFANQLANSSPLMSPIINQLTTGQPGRNLKRGLADLVRGSDRIPAQK